MKGSIVKWIAWAAPLVAIALVNVRYWRKAQEHRHSEAVLEINKKYDQRPGLCAVVLLSETASQTDLAAYEHIGWVDLDNDVSVYDIDKIRKLACDAGADLIRPAALSNGKPLFALFRNKAPIGGRIGAPCASTFDCDPVQCEGTWYRICARVKYPDGRKATFGLCEADCAHASPFNEDDNEPSL